MLLRGIFIVSCPQKKTKRHRWTLSGRHAEHLLHIRGSRGQLTHPERELLSAQPLHLSRPLTTEEPFYPLQQRPEPRLSFLFFLVTGRSLDCHMPHWRVVFAFSVSDVLSSPDGEVPTCSRGKRSAPSALRRRNEREKSFAGSQELFQQEAVAGRQLTRPRPLRPLLAWLDKIRALVFMLSHLLEGLEVRKILLKIKTFFSYFLFFW